RTLGEIKSVKWDPAWGEERLSNMIQTRPDWCISRQRVWGVPIAVFLCEGCDQYRGWFQSSLLCAMGARGTPPYRGVVTPGWTLDEKGQALSKSRGNDVDPVDIANRLGGEIVRLWTASVDFREDVVGSEALMQRVGENYKKIRNTFRFILGNLDGFDPLKDAVAFDQMQPLDQYMLRQAVEVSAEVQRSYEEFAFHKIYHRINNFCGVELSAFYFDVLKD